MMGMALTLAYFKSAPHGNGFDGTSYGYCVDSALCGATLLIGPPVAMASMGPQVVIALTLLPVA